MKKCVTVFCEHMFTFLLGKQLRVECQVITFVCLTLQENVKTFSNMIVLFYSQHCMRVLVIPYLSQHLVFIIHLNIIYSGQCAMTFPCYFNMYLSDDKTCHRRNTYLSMLFVCLLATCKYVLVKIQALCSLYLDYCCFVAVAYIFCN